MSNSLFSSGEDWASNACVNWTHDSMAAYIDGYLKAADILAHKAVESRHDRDTLIFPISFLYRQYIELQLKYIIRESRILLDEGGGFPQHHKIKALWDVANGLMIKIIKEVDQSAKEYITKDDIGTIGKIINDFVEIDPDSFSFRYPGDKNGNKNLDGLSHINIRNLHDQMDVLSKKLDKYDLVVGLLRDWQSEMYSQYEP